MPTPDQITAILLGVLIYILSWMVLLLSIYEKNLPNSISVILSYGSVVGIFAGIGLTIWGIVS